MYYRIETKTTDQDNFSGFFTNTKFHSKFWEISKNDYDCVADYDINCEWLKSFENSSVKNAISSNLTNKAFFYFTEEGIDIFLENHCKYPKLMDIHGLRLQVLDRKDFQQILYEDEYQINAIPKWVN
jgi:hypothetical protein